MATPMFHHHPYRHGSPCPVMCPVDDLRDQGELPADAAHIYTEEKP